MTPDKEYNVLDQHSGFTILTRTSGHDRVPADYAKPFESWQKSFRERGDTLWRPGRCLGKRSPIGTLVEYDRNSFYQLNNDVCKAIYKVAGYRFRIVCWFDNRTGERVG